MAVALLGSKETAPGERRVALTPETARKLGALGITVWYEAGAGLAAGFTDAAYADAGARVSMKVAGPRSISCCACRHRRWRCWSSASPLPA